MTEAEFRDRQTRYNDEEPYITTRLRCVNCAFDDELVHVVEAGPGMQCRRCPQCGSRMQPYWLPPDIDDAPLEIVRDPSRLWEGVFAGFTILVAIVLFGFIACHALRSP
jgi:hypothetical protein